MNKKESKPLYLHLKGAFLSAMAIQESENEHNSTVSLLSNEETAKETDLQEKSNMDVRNQEKDILAVTEELSEDLSAIASSKSEKDEEVKEEEVPAEETSEEEVTVSAEEENKESQEEVDDSEEQALVAVDSEESVDSKENTADEQKAEKDQEPEEKVEDLSDKAEQPAEQEGDNLNKIKALEEENAKLKVALHRILVERVVDAKISAGVEEDTSRDELIESHVTRTASSLADSLRDLVKMPVRKARSTGVPEFNNESTVAIDEQNVTTVDEEGNFASSKEEVSVEQVFVDALMGRRKL
jgi:hypothetical protein